jgi:hypothetical protein
MSAHFAEAGFVDNTLAPSTHSHDAAKILVGDREGVAAMRGIVTAGLLALPVWIGLGTLVYLFL